MTTQVDGKGGRSLADVRQRCRVPFALDVPLHELKIQAEPLLIACIQSGQHLGCKTLGNPLEATQSRQPFMGRKASLKTPSDQSRSFHEGTPPTPWVKPQSTGGSLTLPIGEKPELSRKALLP